jgi:hypothetical protein
MTSRWLITLALVSTTLSSPAIAAVGDLLGTVTLPGSLGGVGGGMVPVAGGVVYVNPQAFFSDQLGIYAPPPGGNGAATLLATKDLRDAGNNPIQVSTVAWDPTRGVLWGALGNNVYTIDLGDPNVSGVALTTFEFNPNVGGFDTVDGLAYDAEADTLWLSPDVNLNVYEFGLGAPSGNPLGQLLSTVTPKNAIGQADGAVSGVVVGSNSTLYIGRNGFQEIRRVDKTTGDFVSNFAQTFGRAEDLSCDPVTYAPLEAIISKELVAVGTYEAFEVEEGTCPLPGLDVGCTLTQGYWKNHNRFTANPSQQIPWPIDEDTLLCGETWLDNLNTAPKGGNAFYILAHQWIAAVLNVADGADDSDVAAEIAEAEVLLNSCVFDTSDRDRAIELADILADYNEGAIGPGHCDDEAAGLACGIGFELALLLPPLLWLSGRRRRNRV